MVPGSRTNPVSALNLITYVVFLEMDLDTFISREAYL
jgi:hypothetical protein